MTSLIQPKMITDTCYQFGEIVLVGRQWGNSHRTTWSMMCPECQQRHDIRRTGQVWTALCTKYGTEWTITPKEYHITKPQDFTKVMGE